MWREETKAVKRDSGLRCCTDEILRKAWKKTAVSIPEWNAAQYNNIINYVSLCAPPLHREDHARINDVALWAKSRWGRKLTFMHTCGYIYIGVCIVYTDTWQRLANTITLLLPERGEGKRVYCSYYMTIYIYYCCTYTGCLYRECVCVCVYWWVVGNRLPG